MWEILSTTQVVGTVALAEIDDLDISNEDQHIILPVEDQ